uniref:Chromo domain-containing protein n=1 Tax=Parascaris univalens TaxID=6257 RepID=A0A915BJ37_PARUN
MTTAMVDHFCDSHVGMCLRSPYRWCGSLFDEHILMLVCSANPRSRWL